MAASGSHCSSYQADSPDCTLTVLTASDRNQLACIFFHTHYLEAVDVEIKPQKGQNSVDLNAICVYLT